MDLTAFLSGEIYRAFLVFVRVGAALMLMPGFGEMAVPARVRLAVALAVSLGVAPVVTGLPAAVPADGSGLLHDIAAEILAGLFVGAGARLFLAALQVTGMLVGQSIGLANPFAVAGTGFEGGTVVSGALVVTALAFIFAADLHYLMIGAILRSYDLMPAVKMPETQALAHRYAELTAASFRLGAALAAPFLAFSVILNLSLGLANRVLPTLPVFFVATPLLTVTGLAMLAATSGAMLAALATGLSDWLAGI